MDDVAFFIIAYRIMGQQVIQALRIKAVLDIAGDNAFVNRFFQPVSLLGTALF